MPNNIINAGSPVLIVDSTSLLNHSALSASLSTYGIAHDIRSILPKSANADIRKTILKKHSLIVQIVYNQCDTSSFVYDADDSEHTRKFLAIDIGNTSLYDTIRQEYYNQDFFYVGLKNNPALISEIVAEYYNRHFLGEQQKETDKLESYSSIFLDVLQRLDDAADAIDAMRLNSTGEVVDELRRISDNLRSKYLQASIRGKLERNDVKNALTTILQSLAVLYDVIENSKLAAIVVSGATTALIGGAGLTTTLNLTVMLAAWHGKDAFLAAVNSISVGRAKAPNKIGHNNRD